jgi:hypothetical protein
MTSPKCVFQNGQLHLRGAPGGDIRLAWRPLPEAAVQRAAGQWQPIIPAFRIVAPQLDVPPDADPALQQILREKTGAFEAFRALLPPAVPAAVEPFLSHQWPLMVLLQQVPAATDLVQANPVLAFAVANNAEFLPGGAPEVAAARAVRLSRMKQRDILEALGFPRTEAMVRLFRKLPVPIVYPGLLRKLRQCAASPEVARMLGHAPALNTGLLFVAAQADMAALVTPRLMQEIARDPDELTGAPAAELLAELLGFAAALHKRSTLRPFPSLRKLRECHARFAHEHQAYEGIVARQKELVALQQQLLANHTYKGRLPLYLAEHMERLKTEYRALEAQRPDRIPRPAPVPDPVREDAVFARLRGIPFPSPPIPGTDTIIPLTSFSDFQEEADSQDICLAVNYHYLMRVHRKDLYVYRILGPERHTLSIARRDAHCWQIAELRRAHNLAATETTRTAVLNWLRAHQLSL